MNLDITIQKGLPDRPVIVFIHGMGVDKGFWTDPVNTKVLGGSIPMKTFAAKAPGIRPLKEGKKFTIGITPEKTNNLWTAVLKKEFNIICWSQRRPVGPIDIAVQELKTILINSKQLFPGNPVVLIGHSRGGLIARKFMEEKHPDIKALITIATPHAGSSLSGFGKYLSPLAPVVKKLLPAASHGDISHLIKKVNDLLEGRALKELLPGSNFYKGLNDCSHPDIQYLSFGGTETKLLTIFAWKKQGESLHPKQIFTIPDSLIKTLPSKITPPELVSGKGDFMVTAKSAKLPWSSEHYNLRSNHISISWNKTVIKRTIELLETI
jgi:pimeloyl-ACP methyl ester carboxylesterase